jgi:hypothetical protein
VSIPPRTPAECFATLLTWLGRAVVAMMGGERLPLQPIALIMDRLRRVNQRFSYVAARIRSGRYHPRRRETPARKRPGQAPPPRDKLPKTFGWLLKAAHIRLGVETGAGVGPVSVTAQPGIRLGWRSEAGERRKMGLTR